MTTNSAFWRDLEAEFRALPDPTGDLHAIYRDGGWTICGGPKDNLQRERLQDLFRSFARRAAIAAGVPSREDALDGWLNLLRTESPYFRNGWAIVRLCIASAEYCIKLATRTFELDTPGPAKVYPTAVGRNIDRLRKECGWSFDVLAEKTGLDKKLTLGHVNEGKGTRPNTLKIYADAFAKRLNRPVTVAELEG
jgi:hypothetical protein